MKRLLPICAALLLALTACTPPADPSPSPGGVQMPSAAESPVPSQGLTVRTDWSKLEPRPDPLPRVGSRWYADYTADLIPREDYGELIPYAGLRLLDDWPASTGCLYGLMTTDGAAVTDPVFSSVSRAGYGGGVLPLLVLRKGDPTLDDNWDPAMLAVAAADGSWVTGYDYRCCRASQQGLLLLTKERLTAMGADGQILHSYSPEEMGLSQKEFDRLFSDVLSYEGVGGTWCGDYISLDWMDDSTTAVRLYQLSTGELTAMGHDEWNDYYAAQSGDSSWEWTAGNGSTTLTRGGESHVIPHSTPDGWVEVQGDLVLFSNSCAVYTLDGKEILPPRDHASVSWMRDALGDGGLLAVTDYSGESIIITYYRPDGTPVPLPILDGWQDTMGTRWYRQAGLVGGLIELLDWNTASYYDLDTGECVFRTYLGYEGE